MNAYRKAFLRQRINGPLLRAISTARPRIELFEHGWVKLHAPFISNSTQAWGTNIFSEFHLLRTFFCFLCPWRNKAIERCYMLAMGSCLFHYQTIMKHSYILMSYSKHLFRKKRLSYVLLAGILTHFPQKLLTELMPSDISTPHPSKIIFLGIWCALTLLFEILDKYLLTPIVRPWWERLIWAYRIRSLPLHAFALLLRYHRQNTGYLPFPPNQLSITTLQYHGIIQDLGPDKDFDLRNIEKRCHLYKLAPQAADYLDRLPRSAAKRNRY